MLFFTVVLNITEDKCTKNTIDGACRSRRNLIQLQKTRNSTTSVRRNFNFEHWSQASTKIMIIANANSYFKC